MHRPSLAVLLLVLALSLSSCGEGHAADAPAPTRLQLTGSSTVAPLARELGRRFEALHPGVRIEVQMGGSSRGIADARRATVDLGMVSRALNADETDLIGMPIARDAVCMIVHRDNPISSLTSDQVRAIYTRTITDWSELGGTAGPIRLVHKAEGRSTHELFMKHFGLGSDDVRPDVVIGSNQQGIKSVGGDPAAIGYVSLGAAVHAAGHGTAIRLVGLDGITATLEHVRDGTFPIGRSLLLVANTTPRGLVKAFVDFATSAEAHDTVESLYFVPLR